MSDGIRPVVVPMGAGDGRPDRLPDYGDFTDAEESPATDFPTSLVSLGFIAAALRRGARLWLATALAGVLLGLGAYAALPVTSHATTTLLLATPPNQNPPDWILTDAALARTRTVAGLALHKLGLQQSVDTFVDSYTVTVVTDRVVRITVAAPSGSEAVRRANALATEFLQFRTGQLEAAESLTLSALDRQISQAKQHIRALTAQIGQLSVAPVTAADQARLKSLQAERTKANTALGALQTNTVDNQASTKVLTTATIKGSWVLDSATPILRSPHTWLKYLILYAFVGFMVGIVLGMAIVVVRALASDRLRRRDDVAHALGARVKLSVGTVRVGRRGLAAAQGRDMRRITEHLRSAVPARTPLRGAALAAVAVDSEQVAALALVSLAASRAGKGEHVVVADLSSGAHAARLLGVKGPGVHAVTAGGAHLVVVLPDHDSDVPAGPLPGTSQPAPDSELAAACAKADLLLTLATLDPSLGGEHLATWAADAVVLVTAGRSSWTKINAVGEMIRLAGVRLVSAVLVGADKDDESLGASHRPDTPALAAAAGQTGESPAPPRLPEVGRGAEVVADWHDDTDEFPVTVDSGPGGGVSHDR